MSKRKIGKRIRTTISWKQWEKISSPWTVFELAKPSKLVLNDITPKLQELAQSLNSDMLVKLGTEKDIINTISEAAKKSPSAPLEAVDGAIVKLYKDFSIDHFDLQDLVDYGFSCRSFVTNFLMFHPIFPDYKCYRVSTATGACYLAYKVIGKDFTVGEESLSAATDIVELAVSTGDRLRPYMFLYIIAYLIEAYKDVSSQIPNYKEEISDLRARVNKLQNKPAEVQYVYRQFGEDRLEKAEQEVRDLKNKLATYELEIEHKYKDLLEAKDRRIAELEQQLVQIEVQEEEIDLPKEVEQVAIPTEDVVVFCSYPPIRTALAKRFPKWKFVSSRSAVVPSASLAVVCTAYISHSMQFKLKSALPDVDICYTSAGNVNRIVSDLKWFLYGN